MTRIVKILQQHDYDHWENVRALENGEENDMNALLLHAIQAAINERYYNTTAKNFAFNPIVLDVKEHPFAQYRLNYLMKFKAGDVGGFDRHRILFRIIETDADSESLKVGDTPTIYPVYNLTDTDDTMAKWINNEALTPKKHLARCLACVIRSVFGGNDRNSRDAFGLYATDSDSIHDGWLRDAERFMKTHTELEAINIVNSWLAIQGGRQRLGNLFGNFTGRG